MLYSKLGQEDRRVKCVSKLLGFSDAACSGDPSLPNEVLYGRAGFLFSLLFVQKNLGAQTIDHDIINKVHIKQIIFLHLKSFSQSLTPTHK